MASASQALDCAIDLGSQLLVGGQSFTAGGARLWTSDLILPNHQQQADDQGCMPQPQPPVRDPLAPTRQAHAGRRRCRSHIPAAVKDGLGVLECTMLMEWMQQSAVSSDAPNRTPARVPRGVAARTRRRQVRPEGV